MPNGGAAKEKFRTTLKRWRLVEPREPLLVAVSGGVDSVVLLHLLNSLPPRERPRLVAAHFDHRLRGAASATDARFVRSLCRRWGVDCRIGRARPWKDRANLEARARELRYRFLGETARKLGLRKILTAHHADDQAETFLIRWVQGAGLRGLGGMSFSRPLEGERVLVRPLLLVSREEILAYARAHHLPYREDPTNASDSFLRSRVRRLMTVLKKENPNIENRSAFNVISLQADETYLSKCVAKVWKKGGKARGKTVFFPLKSYRSLPEALRFRLLQKMARTLRGEAYALPFESVWKVDGILTGEGAPKAYDLPSSLGLLKRKDRLEVFKKPC